MQKGFRADAINMKKTKEGINLNLLAFRSPERIYNSSSCLAGLGSYSNQGHAWQFKVPDNLQFRVTNSLARFFAAIITPWIDIINGRLKQGDCELLMTDSTTAKGWMKKSKFVKHSDDQQLVLTWRDITPNYLWMWMLWDIVSGLQASRIVLQVLSHKTGTGTTMHSPQFYVFTSPNRCQIISNHHH